MRYIVVTYGTRHYLAERRIGSDGYTVIATFNTEGTARKAAALMNKG